MVLGSNCDMVLFLIKFCVSGLCGNGQSESLIQLNQIVDICMYILLGGNCNYIGDLVSIVYDN